jgi:diguanylate cyclase (GGDEF)-like protein
MGEHSLKSGDSVKNKRAYQRHEINLPVRCCTRENFCAYYVARNFCLGGMYIAFDPQPDRGEPPLLLNPSDLIELHIRLPGGAEDEAVLQARVARFDGDSFGVAFVNPNPRSLERIVRHIKESLSRQAAQRRNKTQQKPSVSHEALITAVRQQTLQFVVPTLERFFPLLEKALFDKASESISVADLGAYFEAIDLFQRKRREFTGEFLDETRKVVASSPAQLELETVLDASDHVAETFSLVDDGAIDDWIALSDIAHKVESANHEALLGIEQRLSVLFAMRVEKRNNPVGPDTFAKAFQAAARSFDLRKKAYLVCCRVFRDVLVEDLSLLYDHLNRYLGANGILPDFRYVLKKYGRDDARQASSVSAARPSEPAPARETTTATPSSNPSPTAAPVLNEAGSAAMAERPPLSPVAEHASAATQAPSEREAFADHVEGEHGDELAAALPALLSNLVLMRRHGRAERGARVGIKKDLPAYKTEELVQVLAEMVDTTPPAKDVGAGKAHFDSLALKLLGDLESSGDHTLGDREAAILETTGSIYKALFLDALITPVVKSWISKIELPLLNKALQDESVLSDRSHIVRRFINRLAQLEVYGEDQTDLLGASVTRTIDGFLDKVARHEGSDEVILSSLIKKIDALINVQNRAYADNVNEVIRQCTANEDLPKLVLRESAQSAAAAAAHDPDNVDAWYARVRRIRIGDWILFDVGSAQPRRLKLVWLCEGSNAYVFVNLMGILEGVLSADELARHLSCGNAVFLDNVDEPAFDRAQYSMLQSLYGNVLDESTHDPVTKMLNRREFERRLKSHLTRSSAAAESHVMCFFDIDYFDVVNQTFGYDAGDKVLAEVSVRMTKVLGAHASLARVGGDHFAALLERCSVEQTIKLVEQLRRELSRYRFSYADKKVAITFCAGIVRVDLKQHDIARLLQTAEAACVLAKSKGVNSQHVVEDGDVQSTKRKNILKWALNIDESLNSNALQLRYQLIAPLLDKSLPSHAEILLTVRDASGAMISPEHFILAAERYRRMPEVDRWVINNVFDFLNKNPDKLKKLGGVAINLSGLSINDGSFLDFIMDKFKELTVPARLICFEITETAGIESLSDAAQFVNEVKRAGCSFSLDDFGSGMSSYSYLKNLPVDYLKIDGSFVQEMEKNASDAAVVKSITEIGHFMGKKIIAEWVESLDALKMLRDIGVDYGQGFAIKRPAFLK